MIRPGVRRLFRLPLRRPDLLEQELDDELAAHVALRVEQLVAEGLSPAAARREALRRLGDVAAMRREARRRERRLGARERLGDLVRDLRLAARGLRRSPAFTLTTVATLALGLGATGAIYSVVAPILVEALPYPDAGRLVMVWEEPTPGERSRVGFATYADLAGESRLLAAAAAFGDWQPTVTGEGGGELLLGQRVSASFFDVLGVEPALGRDFRPEDDARDAERVVILGDALWRRRFGGDRGALGSTIALGGAPATVVGILPADFESLLDPAAEIWTPLRYDASLSWACRTCRHLAVVARLRQGVPLAQAEEELDGLSERLVAAHPGEYSGPGMAAVELRDEVAREVRPALVALMGAVALVLAIACGNVANLLLARAARRRGELAVHAALGATRWRLARPLFVESLLLAGLGGGVGVVIAAAGVRALVAFGPPELPRLDQVAVDGGVLGFAAALTAAVGVAFGLVPALAVAREPWRRLRVAGRRRATSSPVVRRALVVGQVAFSLTLLVGAALLLQTLWRLLEVPLGFTPERLLTLRVHVGGPRYASDADVHRAFERVRREVEALPGVAAAAWTAQLPLSGDNDSYGIHLEARPRANPEENPSAHRYAISPGYLATMGIPLLRGRGPAASDDADGPAVAWVSAGFAAREWPGLDPLAQRIRVGDPDDGPWRTVVGVVGDVHQVSLAGTPAAGVYLPAEQWPWADSPRSLVVRARADAAALAEPVRAAIRRVDADLAVSRVATAEALVGAATARTRFALFLFAGFAAVALALVAVGLFGVLAATVSERRTELGIRAALGASRRGLVALVIRQGLLLTVAGALLGIVVSAALGEVVGTLLFGVSRLDPWTHAGVVALLAVVALVACWGPARRAGAVDPATTLRADGGG